LRLDRFTFHGEVPETRFNPTLSLYSYGPSARRGADVLALAEHGVPYVARPDRRFRHGFRWVPAASIYAALARSGVDTDDNVHERDGWDGDDVDGDGGYDGEGGSVSYLDGTSW
jgi:hypothetical protein